MNIKLFPDLSQMPLPAVSQENIAASLFFLHISLCPYALIFFYSYHFFYFIINKWLMYHYCGFCFLMFILIFVFYSYFTFLASSLYPTRTQSKVSLTFYNHFYTVHITSPPFPPGILYLNRNQTNNNKKKNLDTKMVKPTRK